MIKRSRELQKYDSSFRRFWMYACYSALMESNSNWAWLFVSTASECESTKVPWRERNGHHYKSYMSNGMGWINSKRVAIFSSLIKIHRMFKQMLRCQIWKFGRNSFNVGNDGSTFPLFQGRTTFVCDLVAINTQTQLCTKRTYNNNGKSNAKWIFSR